LNHAPAIELGTNGIDARVDMAYRIDLMVLMHRQFSDWFPVSDRKSLAMSTVESDARVPVKCD